MAGSPGPHGGQLGDLCARARAARRETEAAWLRSQATWQQVRAAWQRAEAAWGRAEAIRELGRAPAGPGELLRYSAYARAQARLASMPVIEQAKGVIMARTGLPPDQAFDALRWASQHHNVPVRDLAAEIVAGIARSAGARSGRTARQDAARAGPDAA